MKINDNIMIACNLKGWISTLRRHRFSISPAYLPRFIMVTLIICFFEVQRFFVSWTHRKDRIPVEEVALGQDPIFILGYWRSGTTHLHNILELNGQFAGLGMYEMIFPNTLFKIRSKWLEFIIRRTAPTTRPMDNVALHPDAVQEEEVAMLYLCGLTPFAHWVFPRERETCQKYFNFEESPKEYHEWKSFYLKLLKELSYTTKKRLLLKSPPHTGRILRLLELFPNAKFIHIHRNPYEVFLSNLKFQATAGKSMRMQTITDAQMEDEVIKMYKFAYGLFFRDVAQIPRGNFTEISYDELCESPLRTVKKIYSDLHLDGFDSVKPRTIAYLTSLENYKKKQPSKLKQRTQIKNTTRMGIDVQSLGIRTVALWQRAARFIKNDFEQPAPSHPVDSLTSTPAKPGQEALDATRHLIAAKACSTRARPCRCVVAPRLAIAQRVITRPLRFLTRSFRAPRRRPKRRPTLTSTLDR